MGVCSKCGLRTVSQDCECLQRQLQQAQQDLAKERENGLREANACEQARLAALRAHDDLAEAQAEKGAAIERAEAAEALVERLVTDIGHWVMAYGPDLVVYPSKEEIRAVNETPEFRIGRNATMQVVSEGLQAILSAPAEAQAREEEGSDA